MQMKRKKLSFRAQSNIAGYCFVIIPVLGFIFFMVIPSVYSLLFAMQNSDGGFVGFENFAKAFRDPYFFSSFGNSFTVLIGLAVQIVVALLVALLLTVNVKGQSIFRAFFFIPSLCSAVAITFVWKVLYDTNYGLLNNILWSMGLDGINWLGYRGMALVSIMIKGVWMGIGGGMVMYISSLKNVSKSLYEAAEIDGARTVRQFFSITLPSISPTTFYLLITSIIGTMTDFASYQLMIGEIEATTLNYAATPLALYIYNTAFTKSPFLDGNTSYNYATAMSWLLSIVIIGIIGALFASQKKWVHYND